MEYLKEYNEFVDDMKDIWSDMKQIGREVKNIFKNYSDEDIKNIFQEIKDTFDISKLKRGSGVIVYDHNNIQIRIEEMIYDENNSDFSLFINDEEYTISSISKEEMFYFFKNKVKHKWVSKINFGS